MTRPTALDTLPESLARIFDQSQASTTSHRKNCVTLYKLQAQTAAVTQTVKGNAIKLTGEQSFTEYFLELFDRVLVIKKGVQAADRVVRFLGTYMKFLNEKTCEQKSSNPAQSITARLSEDDDDTTTSRFVARILKHLLKGFSAKDKTIRFRCVGAVAELIAHLGELDEDTFIELRSALLERVYDRESHIRAQACIALAKLSGSENPSDLIPGECSIVETLLDVLLFDASSEVRRAAVLHTPLIPTTLPALLTRSRDVDPITRKLLYSSVLTKLAHPKQLTISQRELIVRHGLGDREEVVRVATAKLLGTWVDVLGGDLVELLSVFDVISGDVAVDVLASLFVTRPDILDGITFDDAFWAELTPETALLARVFVEHKMKTQSEADVTASLPVVTSLAFQLQAAYNSYLELLQLEEEARLLNNEDDEELEARDNELADKQFIIGEILRLAIYLDYTDEVGRRKMFAVVRGMVAHQSLPESLIAGALDILGALSFSERDLIRIVAEAINELRDSDDTGDESRSVIDDDVEIDSTLSPSHVKTRRAKEPHQMAPEDRLKVDLIDLRCLVLCIGMLERVNGSFDDNSTLEGILADLIIPAVKRKELALREKGLSALGLCCLIARTMAVNSFQLFLSQVQSAPDNLKVKMLQVVFDLLMVHERDFLTRPDSMGERIIVFLLHLLETEDSKGVQAVLCVGISKLLLCGLVTDERVLTSLILAYVSPATADNLELRQCLSYFIPVYCYSSPVNQSRMRSVFISAYDLVTQVHNELEDEHGVINPFQFGQLFVDWTNPQKVVDSEIMGTVARDVHVDLAIDILKALYSSERTDDDRKTLCQLLVKLYLPDEPEQHALWTLHILISHLHEQCPLDDPGAEKIMSRFRTRFEIQFKEQLENFDNQQCIQDTYFRELFDFIGVIVPHAPSDDSDQTQQTSFTRNKSETAGGSIVSTDPEAFEEKIIPDTPSRRKGKEKAKPKSRMKAKHQALHGRSDESASDSNEGHLPLPTTPQHRTRAKRLRSPEQVKSVESPVRKKRHRPRTSGDRDACDPFGDSTNRHRSTERRGAASDQDRQQARMLLRNEAEGEIPDETLAGDINETAELDEWSDGA